MDCTGTWGYPHPPETLESGAWSDTIVITRGVGREDRTRREQEARTRGKMLTDRQQENGRKSGNERFVKTKELVLRDCFAVGLRL